MRIEENKFYTTQEMAQLLRVSGQTISRWCASGILPGFKVPGGRKWLVRGGDLLSLHSHGIIEPEAERSE